MNYQHERLWVFSPLLLVHTFMKVQMTKAHILKSHIYCFNLKIRCTYLLSIYFCKLCNYISLVPQRKARSFQKGFSFLLLFVSWYQCLGFDIERRGFPILSLKGVFRNFRFLFVLSLQCMIIASVDAILPRFLYGSGRSFANSIWLFF